MLHGALPVLTGSVLLKNMFVGSWEKALSSHAVLTHC